MTHNPFARLLAVVRAWLRPRWRLPYALPEQFALKRKVFWKRLLFAPKAFRFHYRLLRKQQAVSRWQATKVAFKLALVTVKQIKPITPYIAPLEFAPPPTDSIVWGRRFSVHKPDYQIRVYGDTPSMIDMNSHFKPDMIVYANNPNAVDMTPDNTDGFQDYDASAFTADDSGA